MDYYIYMLRCEDNSVYTGIASSLSRRMEEHFSKCEKCAKYTKKHTAQKLECAWKTENRSLASKLEYRIKHLKKQEKEELIQKRGSFEILLGAYLEKSDFKRLTKKDLKKACTFEKKDIQ